MISKEQITKRIREKILYYKFLKNVVNPDTDATKEEQATFDNWMDTRICECAVIIRMVDQLEDERKD